MKPGKKAKESVAEAGKILRDESYQKESTQSIEISRGWERLSIPKQVIRDIVKEELKKKRKEALQGDEIVVLEREENEEKAKSKIKRFIQKKKEQGETKVDEVEMMEELKLPSDQINTIMREFEKE